MRRFALALVLASACSGRPAGPATTSTTGEGSSGEASEPRWTTGVMLPTTEATTGAALAPEACERDADCPAGQACVAADGVEGRCRAPAG